MKPCKTGCGAPTEADRYEFCHQCWWAQDPRNPKNEPRIPKKGAGRRLAEKLKQLGNQPPPESLMVKLRETKPERCARYLRWAYVRILWFTLFLGVQHYTGHWCIAFAAVAAVSLLVIEKED